jgi:hypothetical protein
METKFRPRAFQVTPAIFALLLATAIVQAAPPTADATGKNVPLNSGTPGVQEEDIRDIRPPIHIAAPWPWAASIASTAALFAAGYGLWRWNRKTRPSLRPFEIALAKLEAARALMQRETARQFSLAVSDAVRVYIEESFPVRAAHRTTDEFLHELAAQPNSPLNAHRETFEGFLHHCDLAKFARWDLSTGAMEAMLASARTFVLSLSAPTPTAAPASGPALVSA